MKKEVTVTEVRCFCDFCGEPAPGYYKCLGCGKDFCWDCEKTKAKKYRHSTIFMGSYDGCYCPECDMRLSVTGDVLHDAYLVVERLIDESRRWREDFDKRSNMVEDRIKYLLEKKEKGE